MHLNYSHTIFPADDEKYFDSFPAKWKKGDLVRYSPKFSYSRIMLCNNIVVVDKCYILAGIMYYKVFTSSNRRITVLREDEMETF